MSEHTPEEIEQSQRTNYALQVVGKWRSVLMARMLGTTMRGEPMGEGLRDLFEKFIMLRVEVTALTGLLLERGPARMVEGGWMEQGIISQLDLMRAVEREADALSKAYEIAFPGMHATIDGITYDLPQAMDTMRAQGFPP